MKPATPLGLPVFFAYDLRFIFLTATAVFLTIWSGAPCIAETNAVLLQEQSASLKLSSKPPWLRLLHYHAKGTYVDDAKFFLAADGETDPAAELTATLSAFIDKPESRCRFPARYTWLSSQLDMSGLPVQKQECSEYKQWLASVDASEVVIVLAASYINSPSSMYGHTFLRFDPADMESNSPVLSYALNFGAIADEGDGGVLYAVKGLVGSYSGRFVASPYVVKVKEYNRLENRDLWEYHLRLSPDQIDMMLAHVWELGKISFDYYFFDENCSFRLLELIEVARPDLDLTSQFGVYAIPIDTVKIVAEAGLIDRVYYRASNQAVVTYNIDKLDRGQQKIALALSEDIAQLESAEFLALSPEDQSQVAYTAYKYLRYRVNEQQRDPEAAKRSYTLLRYLSANNLGILDAQKPVVPDRPDLGHETSMLSLSAGAEDGKWFSDLEWRIAYHDLLDNGAGYPRDTSLNMARITLRYREGDGVQLQKLDLFEVASLAYRDKFYKPIAWQANFGFDRQWTNGDDELTFHGAGGFGLSYKTLFNGRLIGMLLGRAEYNDGFSDSNVDLAGGGGISYLYQGDRGSARLSAQTLHFIGGTDRQLIEFQQNIVLTTNNALRFTYKHNIDETEGINEASLAYRFYF